MRQLVLPDAFCRLSGINACWLSNPSRQKFLSNHIERERKGRRWRERHTHTQKRISTQSLTRAHTQTRHRKTAAAEEMRRQYVHRDGWRRKCATGLCVCVYSPSVWISKCECVTVFNVGLKGATDDDDNDGSHHYHQLRDQQIFKKRHWRQPPASVCVLERKKQKIKRERGRKRKDCRNNKGLKQNKQLSGGNFGNSHSHHWSELDRFRQWIDVFIVTSRLVS